MPPSNIKRITGSDATRAAILHELAALASNPSSQRDDPILIYYAGHGSSGRPPAEWNVDDARIEYIVPYDCSPETPAIPDRTIAACLDGIAKSKGNNIVCHFLPPCGSALTLGNLRTLFGTNRPSSSTAAIPAPALAIQVTSSASATLIFLPILSLQRSTRRSGALKRLPLESLPEARSLHLGFARQVSDPMSFSQHAARVNLRQKTRMEGESSRVH